MFIKNAEKHSNLWEVPFEDLEVTEIYNEIDAIIGENLEVIVHVTDLYQPFEFVMKEKEILKHSFQVDPKEKFSKKEFRLMKKNLNY